MLYKLAIQTTDNQTNESSGSETDSSLSWVPNVLNNPSRINMDENIMVEDSPNLNTGKNLESPENLPSLSLKQPFLQKKKVNFLNRLESETDESDYQDKYIPRYMSSKKMLSPSDEFFVDEDNSVYGRVKI